MIFLMRHGEDDPERLGGWSSAGLTERGMEQARDAARRLRTEPEYSGIRRIWSSDLPRARETALTVGDMLGLPVTGLPPFRETNNGKLAGMTKTEAREKYPGVYYAALGFEERYPGGESPREFRDRIVSAWEAFRTEEEALPGDALLVTHAGVIGVILCRVNGEEYTNRERKYRTPFCGIVPVP